MRITLLTIAVVMLAATQASAALILTDGSFETEANNGAAIPPPGPTGGWNVIGQGSFTPVSPFGGATALDGTQFIQITSGTAAALGRISQDLGMTDVESDVTLSANFIQRGNAGGLFGTAGGYSFGLYSDAAGTVPLAQELDQVAGVANSDVWVSDSVTASNVPAGTTVYAFFTAAGPNPSTSFLFIDDVTLSSVASIPEPSSMLLLGLGVLGLGVVRRRRQS